MRGVFRSERAAIAAIKSRDEDERIKAGDIMVLTCGGPLGTGMEEVYQITAALKHLSYGKHVALITDARFSGVSTGACIGHVGPEALAGGPIGKVREGDIVEIVVDRNELSGSINLVGEGGDNRGAEWGDSELEMRPDPNDLEPHPSLPDDSRLWAALQHASGRYLGRLRVRRGLDHRNAGSRETGAGFGGDVTGVEFPHSGAMD